MNLGDRLLTMTGPTRRALSRIYTLLAIGVLVLVALVAFPWLITPYYSGPTTSINGTAYCYEPVYLDPPGPWHYLAWGFAFSITSSSPSPSYGGVYWNISVTEPQGVTYSGGTGCTVCPVNQTLEWFTPDGLAGVSFSTLTTLYVEK